MGIKYEAVFGPQELFDSTVGTINEDALIVLARNDYKVFFQNIEDAFSWMQKDESYRSKCICSYAMRRIIRTPTWTVADQKDGKLPEVGSVLNHKTQGECTFIGSGVDDKSHWALKLKNDLIYIADKNLCAPIETPEERAKREEDEWVSKAWSETAAFIGWPGLCAECELKRGE